MLVLVLNDETQDFSDGTTSPEFKNVFNCEKEAIIEWLNEQLTKHLVRNDYKELVHVIINGTILFKCKF